MSKLTGKGLVKFAKSKLGTPYVYGAKGEDGKLTLSKLNWLRRNYPGIVTSSYYNKAKKYVGKVCCDCSSLANSWYCGVKYQYGSAQLYQKAKKRMPIKNWKKFPIGTILYKEGHVGVYIGDGKVIEAKGINFGVVKTNISSTKWKYGLLMPWIDYSTGAKRITKAKKKNPYNKPSKTLKRGSKGEGVKWVQFELNEAGYTKLVIDGKYGISTENTVKKFQRSCKFKKITGEVGPKTRKKLEEK